MSIDELRKKFKGDLVLPSDPDYNEAIARWAINAQKKASVVAFVRDSADVAEAILYAKSNKLEVAIRGGGHHTSGASSTDGGLVIDLSRHLNTCKVDADKRLAYVDGGALLEAVDVAAIKHGLATVVGTINHTGIGGLVLGGGYGYQSPAHGLAIDNLVEVTIVTADGSVRTANQTSNPDLFWGVRGAGSNFGVVTQFVLKLHPQRATTFAGILIYPPPLAPKVAAAIAAWYNGNPSEKEVVYQVISRGPDGKPFIGVILFYNGSKEEGRQNFKSFFDLNPVADMCQEIPYEKVNGMSNAMAPHGLCRYTKSVFITHAQEDPTPKIMERWFALSSENSPVQYSVFHEYFPGDKIAEVPADATAFFHRQKSSHALCLATWKEDTPENFAIAKKGTSELIQPSVELEGISADLGYSNYRGEAESSTNRTIFGDNYPRLQKIKSKYDPEGLFSKWYAISPA